MKTSSVEGNIRGGFIFAIELQNGERKKTNQKDKQSDTTCYSNLPLLIEKLHQNWLIFLP